jgi:predicted lipid-binding transport protein (Tim44 family)
MPPSASVVAKAQALRRLTRPAKWLLPLQAWVALRRRAATAGAAGAAGAAAKAGGASRWLGPLAGIAAGGLLASMFMGGGFQGMQIFDILIMAVIAFLVFRFIAARRRKQQEHMAPAGHAPMQREVFEHKPAGGSIFGGSAAPVPRAR